MNKHIVEILINCNPYNVNLKYASIKSRYFKVLVRKYSDFTDQVSTTLINGLNNKIIRANYIQDIIDYLNNPNLPSYQISKNEYELQIYKILPNLNKKIYNVDYIVCLFEYLYIGKYLLITDLYNFITNKLVEHIKHFTKNNLLSLIHNCIPYKTIYPNMYAFPKFDILYDIQNTTTPNKNYYDLVVKIIKNLKYIKKYLDIINLKFSDIFNKIYPHDLDNTGYIYELKLDENLRNLILKNFKKEYMYAYLRKLHNIKYNIEKYKIIKPKPVSEPVSESVSESVSEPKLKSYPEEYKIMFYREGFIEHIIDFMKAFYDHVKKNDIYFTKLAVLNLNDFVRLSDTDNNVFNGILVYLINNEDLLEDNNIMNSKTATLEDMCSKLDLKDVFKYKIKSLIEFKNRKKNKPEIITYPLIYNE